MIYQGNNKQENNTFLTGTHEGRGGVVFFGEGEGFSGGSFELVSFTTLIWVITLSYLLH